MKYLMAIWDGGGATPPNLGVARLLTARGHHVVVCGDTTLAGDVFSTGAEYRTWPTAPQRRSAALDDDVLKDWEARTPVGKMARLRDRLMVGPSKLFADDVTAALDAEHFDAVLADGILLGALIGAEARRVPVAVLVGSVYLAPSPVRPPAGRIPPARGRPGRVRDRVSYALINAMSDSGLRQLNATRAAHGLRRIDHLWDQWNHANRVLMLTSSTFDDPPPDAPNVRYVGPVLEDIPADVAVATPPGDDPLIVVGLSSSYMEQADLLRRISTALSGLPVRGIITTGPAINPREVHAAANVTVVQSAAHNQLIPKAALVITHAGHGTLIKALANGVPVLCMPLGRDQPDNAARAKRHGVALVLSRRASSASIANAVRAMLDQPSYARQARALGARIRSEIATGALLAELEGLPGLAATD
jgi:MGT family glycosyltransferase